MEESQGRKRGSTGESISISVISYHFTELVIEIKEMGMLERDVKRKLKS